MKTIVQLLIVALILHACYRGGVAAWKYYNFKDAVTQEARFSSASDAVLHQRILELAAEHQVDLDPGDLAVSRDGARTTVAAAYYEFIELVPSLYTREHLFEFEVTVSPRPLTPDAAIP